MSALDVAPTDRFTPPAREFLCIAIPTFRRTAFLAELLAGVARQHLGAAAPAVDVVVLDNDPEGSAAVTVEAARSTFPFALTHHVVESPGLCAVRNAALKIGRGYDYLAMIDDDEVPEPQWLAELVRVMRAAGVGAVVGPVPPLLEPSAPRWLASLHTAEFPSARDGVSVREAWSGNCLLRTSAVAATGVSFEPDLNFTGGEDQLFFRQFVARGEAIAYAAHARAWEFMPPERRTLRFALARAFRRGMSLAECDRRIPAHRTTGAVRALKGLAFVLLGALKFVPAALCAGAPGAVRACTQAAGGAGMLAGMAGVRYAPYRRESTIP